MALNQKIASEQILDLAGQPLQADASALLKAFDKLLTLGAYYSTSHEQYLLAAEEAARVIGQAIGSRPALALEITSEGLMILGQRIDPHHRNVHQVHDLLVPLNIARLEVAAGVTAADLRQALAALQNHKLLLGQSHTFQEIIIEGLPATVRSVSCSVLQNDKAAQGAVRGLAAVQAMMDEWQRGGGNDDSERLAKEFLELVTEILENLEQSQLENAPLGQDQGGAALSGGDIAALRQALERLVEVNPSPRTLLQLITHARSALDISRDPDRADLVFKILRKEVLAEPNGPAKAKTGAKREVKYKLSVGELMAAVEDLATEGYGTPDPEAEAVANHLHICLHLLASDPPDALRQNLLESLGRTMKKASAEEEILAPCRDALKEALESGFAHRAENMLEGVTAALRRGRPALVGRLWADLKESCETSDYSLLWPYLANDLLLGLGAVEAPKRGALLEWLGEISLPDARLQMERLKAMPCLDQDKAAPDLFKAPLASLYSVHAALAETRLAGWLGQGIHKSLKARPFNRLVRALMPALDEYQSANLPFYLDLLAQSQSGELTEDLRLRCGALLLGLLADLPRVRRQEAWVPEALAELVRLDLEEARPLLDDVRNARRWIFLKAWPPACRLAAARGGEV